MCWQTKSDRLIIYIFLSSYISKISIQKMNIGSMTKNDPSWCTHFDVRRNCCRLPCKGRKAFYPPSAFWLLLTYFMVVNCKAWIGLACIHDRCKEHGTWCHTTLIKSLYAMHLMMIFLSSNPRVATTCISL